MIEFTKDEKNTIAEFVFSFQADVLIISDAEKLIDTFANHNLITDKENWQKRITAQDSMVCGELFKIALQKISIEQGKAIMDEYYGRR